MPPQNTERSRPKKNGRGARPVRKSLQLALFSVVRFVRLILFRLVLFRRLVLLCGFLLPLSFLLLFLIQFLLLLFVFLFKLLKLLLLFLFELMLFLVGFLLSLGVGVLFHSLTLLNLLLFNFLAFLVLFQTQILELLLLFLFDLGIRVASIVCPRRRRPVIVDLGVARIRRGVAWPVRIVLIRRNVARLIRITLVRRSVDVSLRRSIRIIRGTLPIWIALLHIRAVAATVLRGSLRYRRRHLHVSVCVHATARRNFRLSLADLRNRRGPAAIRLNHLLLLGEGNGSWRRSRLCHDGAVHDCGGWGNVRRCTGAENAALLRRNGRSHRSHRRRSDLALVHADYVVVNRLSGSERLIRGRCHRSVHILVLIRHVCHVHGLVYVNVVVDVSDLRSVDNGGV